MIGPTGHCEARHCLVLLRLGISTTNFAFDPEILSCDYSVVFVHRSCLAITMLCLCTDLVLRLQCCVCAQTLSCDYNVVFVHRSCLAIIVLCLCTDFVLRLQCCICAQILSCDYSVVFVQFPPFLFCMLCTLALCSEWVSGCEFSRCLGFQEVHDVALPTQCAS
jgi:hypothetical protein